MSDYVPNTSQWPAAAACGEGYAGEFRLLMFHLFHNDLSDSEVRNVHWILKLPKRILDEPCLSGSVLRCLEERNVLKNWCGNPNSFKQFLCVVLKRLDLGDKVQTLSDKYADFRVPQNSSNTIESIQQLPFPCQETFSSDCQPVAHSDMDGFQRNNSVGNHQRLVRKNSMLKSLRRTELETVKEEDTPLLQRRSVPVTDTDPPNDPVSVPTTNSRVSRPNTAVNPVHVESENGSLYPDVYFRNPQVQYGKHSLTRTSSNASSGYSSQRSSDARLSHSYRMSDGSACSGYRMSSGSFSSSHRMSDGSTYSGCRMSDGMFSSSYRVSADMQVPMPGSTQLEQDQPFICDEYSEDVSGDNSSHSQNDGKSMAKEADTTRLLQPVVSQSPDLPSPNEPDTVVTKADCPHEYNRSRLGGSTFDPQDEFRPRSSSLPAQAKHISYQVVRNIRKGSNASCSDSLEDHSEVVIDAHLSSQMSLLSTGQSSSGSSNGSQESVNTNSLKRNRTVSSVFISGEIQISQKKIFRYITESKQGPLKSNYFPLLKTQGIRYEFRFFPTNFSKLKDSCALYLDISRDFLRHENAKAKKFQITTIGLPKMKVTASVHATHTHQQGSQQPVEVKECIGQETKSVPATTLKVSDLTEFVKSKQNYITVTSFPHLVKHSDIARFRDKTQQGKVIIKIVIEYY